MSRIQLQRQDTFDLRDQIHADDHSHLQAHADAAVNYTDDEEHSVLEDDSEGEEQDEYMDDDDDGSSSLSIPNESIDFDLVYSLHSFAATVEGQANVVKGDSLFLMDDSNSYWWLVRVLKTQEVGYIPAENIETPFERLARLNKHRNVDLASATQTEQQEGQATVGDRLRTGLSSRTGSSKTPSPAEGRSRQLKGVQFTPTLSVHRYLPAVWKEEEMSDEDDVEWDDEGYEDEDQGLAIEQMQRRREEEELGPGNMEPDDGMQWDDAAAQDIQIRQVRAANTVPIPDALQPGSQREQQQQQQLRAQQQQQLQAQQQQQLMAQQQQQQQQQQAVAQQAAAQQAVVQQGAQQQQVLRTVSSRERLNASPASQAPRRIDPAEATETRKLTVTPNIARDTDERPPGQPYLPSQILEKQQEEERNKRQREEDAAAADEVNKRKKGKEKMAPPVSSASLAKPQQPGKLRKEPSRDSQEEESNGKDKDKKKKSSVFSGLFSRKKEKSKDRGRSASIGSMESEYTARGSEESSRSGHRPNGNGSPGEISPTTAAAIQQQKQQQQQALNNARSSPVPNQVAPSTPERSTTLSQVSPHASQLRQRDQQQQALYQQYLNRSPSSPPEAQPSYGLQSASAVMSYTSSSSSTGSALGPPTSRPRPGSLILTASAMDGPGPGVPELSVIRVFAGKHLQTEATFKTVLLNSSTTSSDLVRQAIQRFRLSAGEDEDEYYLTVKQVEGGASAVLLPKEKPLVVFETLVVEAMEVPKVKRSSVGSISSIASNLSMHPAIKKLSMNDFTDDSAVKFYLNRRADGVDDSENGHEGDDTLIADTSHGGESDLLSPRPQYLSAAAAAVGGGGGGGANVTPERFSSPSFRFPLQLVIYPDDLPDDMVFHPTTEAIVFKDTLRDTNTAFSTPVSSTMRKKVFVFPKNVTVAEVIELGLERFGILEGVVDGGDEVEDKFTKRRSSIRVRYQLIVDTGHNERELAPSSKVIDAFPRPPTYRAPDRQLAVNKRRSVDSAQLLGSLDDVHPDDPVFILRRAISYRNSTSRHRTSAPLDEIALQQLHLNRESASSANTDLGSPINEDTKPKQPSRQEIIAAQRAATRANQRAILSAQTNSVRGMDVLLPGNALLRSSRYDSNDRMRYSYVEADGETYDISDIVEEEWRENNPVNKNDLLEGVLAKNKDTIGDKLDRVLNKIKNEKAKERDISSLSSSDNRRSSIPSEYSVEDSVAHSRSVTPGSGGFTSKMPSGNAPRASPTPRGPRPDTTTTPAANAGLGHNQRPSIASVMSDLSSYGTAQTQTGSPQRGGGERSRTETPKPRQQIYLPKDDFGFAHMMAIIEYKASKPKVTTPPRPLDPVDELLFGAPLDLESLHPQAREIYASGFKQLEEMDKILDSYIRPPIGSF